MSEVLLNVQNLSKYFFSRKWRLPSLTAATVTVKAVDRCTLELNRGDILGVVGESGSGKTTLGQTIARIIDPTGGSVNFDGREISRVQGQQLKALRREIQMVFQDPGSPLNPRHRIDDIIALPLRIHLGLSGKQGRERAKELLHLVQLPAELMPRIRTR